jgi:hypothetical protein
MTIGSVRRIVWTLAGIGTSGTARLVFAAGLSVVEAGGVTGSEAFA